MDRTNGTLDEARERGRAEAEQFDAALRELESRERLERLRSLARYQGTDALRGRWGDLVSLQDEVQRLAAFERAVLNSRAWRLIQALRRPFGRAW
jgi:hypothetical protein